METKLNRGGIYRIKNLINGKSYIGSTVNFYNRKRAHFSKLRLNYNGNINLQKEFNLYGEKSFKFEILENISNLTNKQDLHKREQYYINILNPSYNIAKLAGSNKGYKMSENTIKIRTEKQSIKINQFDLNNNFIKEWSSALVAAKSLNLNSCHIRECCRNIRKTCGGFIWKDK